MEACIWRPLVLLAALSSLGASYRTTNFIVNAPDVQLAEEVGRAAETYRRDLSLQWLGYELPRWSEPCPVTAHVGNMGAGGVTQFNFARDGRVFGWQMAVQGSRKRILDSVLPHEITHTIFATHFKRPLPRWADEGACTTVEHVEERARQQKMLVHFLQNGKGISFTKMFAMMEYPRDMLPLYAQGYSLSRFFIEQGGRRKFVEYVSDGLAGDRWEAATAEHYGYRDMFQLQDAWLDWVRRGSPNIESGTTVASADSSSQSQEIAAVDQQDSRTVVRGQSGEREGAITLAGPLVTVGGKSTAINPAPHEAGNALTSARGLEAGWRAIGGPRNDLGISDSGAGEPVAAVPSAPQTQAARPQNVERSRQVILEWNHQPQAAAEAPATGHARRSIYDTSRSGRGILRR